MHEVSRKSIELSGELPDLVVVDVETTGGRSPQHRVIEVGAVKLRDGAEHRSLATLIHPRRSLPPFITSLTGITPAMLARAPYFEEIADVLWDFMDGAVFCAHNATFDARFLRAEFERYGTVPPPLKDDYPILCTMRLGRRLLPELTDHRLDTIAAYMGLSFTRRHRALGDALVTAQIMINFIDMMKERGITDLKRILKLQRSRIPRPV